MGRSGQAQKTLTQKQRNILAERLTHPTNKTGDLSFSQIRKLLKLSQYDYFNLESKKRTKLKGEETAAKLMQEDRWGHGWFDLSLETQDEIVDHILNEEKDEALITYFKTNHNLEDAQACRVADCPLPDGHGRLSKEALDKIIPHLETGLLYSEAATEAFGSHRPLDTKEIFDRQLPYYGVILDRSVAFGSDDPDDPDEKRYGKIANPTVHVALNQIRAVINDLMKRFGPPEEIVLELARDLPLSAKGKSELESKQKKNQEDNERRGKLLEDEFKQPNNYENRMRLRLYDELEPLGRRCVYTGKQIGCHNLFSPEVEIEHILPFSRTFDDSFSNKTLSLRSANRDKKNQTPYEAFAHSPEGYDWEGISKRVAEFPVNKQWRFGPEAMERFEQEGEDFLDRQLTDTRYIGRLAKEYLEVIYGGQGHKGSKNHVWVIPGKLTSDLRWHWGLDSVLRGHNEEVSEAQKKNRYDHRHHMIDAIVVGCTDRSMLQRAANQARQNDTGPNDRLLAGIEPPLPELRNDVIECVNKVVVSHKPDHGIQDAMHNDTAYGIPKGEEGEPDKKGVRTVVTRKHLDSESFKSSKDLEKIRDSYTKNCLLAATYGLTGKEFKAALLEEAKCFKPALKRVRIEEKLRVIPIKNSSEKIYKAYKGDGNYCYDIWCDPKGKWVGDVISTFDAYQLAQKNSSWWKKMTGRDGQKLLMRLRKNDCLQIEQDGRKKIVQVYKFSTGVIFMAEHYEANIDARMRKKELKPIQMAPSSLQKNKAKRVTISPSGVLKLYH